MYTIERTTGQEHVPCTRIQLTIDGEDISNVSVLDLPMRVGGAVVRCGGIGGMSTLREHRNKGYARRVLTEALEHMREERYHLSALFGIADFYDRFGYGPGLVECEAQVITRYAERAAARHAVRDFRPEDAPVVAEMHEALHRTRTASIVRDPATWTRFERGTRWTDRVGAFVVLDGERPIGYASYDLDPWRCAIAEVGYSGPAAYDTIIAQAARIAWERRLERITFHAPPDDPFIRYCRRYGCEVRANYPCSGNGMARVIDQAGLLGTLRPVLEERLRRSGIGWRGTVVIATDLGTDRLALGAGAPEVRAEMPQWMLAQLVLGYRGAEEVALDDRATIDEGAVPALRALFPEGYPYVNWSDRF